MLSNKELTTLRQLRVKLLHYWQKFPDASLEKNALNEWQDVLDKIILREQKRIDYSGGQSERV